MGLIPQLLDGLSILPYNRLVAKSAAHMARSGKWSPGVLRPSLLALDCRLARVKTFLGHAPQPGATFDHARGGEPDPASNLVMARGAWMESIVVTALEAAEVPIVLRSPDVVRSQETLSVASPHSHWITGAGWRYECHPDLIIGPQAHLVQIKCPSDRALSYFKDGRSDMARTRYGPQILAKLYIAELAGWEPEGATLLMVSAEPWPPTARNGSDPAIRAFEVEFAWGDQQRAAIQARIDETKADIEAARHGIWPNPLALSRAKEFPCAWCPYPRVATFAAPASCDNAAAWSDRVPALRVVG